MYFLIKLRRYIYGDVNSWKKMKMNKNLSLSKVQFITYNNRTFSKTARVDKSVLRIIIFFFFFCKFTLVEHDRDFPKYRRVLVDWFQCARQIGQNCSFDVVDVIAVFVTLYIYIYMYASHLFDFQYFTATKRLEYSDKCALAEERKRHYGTNIATRSRSESKFIDA